MRSGSSVLLLAPFLSAGVSLQGADAPMEEAEPMLYSMRDVATTEMARRYPAVAKSISRGLSWIAARQGPDGSWSVEDSGAAESAHDGVLLTAAALLPFLAEGASPEGGEYAATVRHGIRWLVRQQDESGRIAVQSDGNTSESHPLATVALVETASVVPRPDLVDAANRALAWMRNGRVESDWATLALALAQHVGGPLRSAADESPSTQSTPSKAGGLYLLTAYLLSRGKQPQVPDAWLQRAALELEGNDATTRAFGAAGLYQVGGRRWDDAWRRVCALTEFQEADGSWEPADPCRSRLWETAFNVLTLQTRYRYARVADRR